MNANSPVKACLHGADYLQAAQLGVRQQIVVVCIHQRYPAMAAGKDEEFFGALGDAAQLGRLQGEQHLLPSAKWRGGVHILFITMS